MGECSGLLLPTDCVYNFVIILLLLLMMMMMIKMSNCRRMTRSAARFRGSIIFLLSSLAPSSCSTSSSVSLAGPYMLVLMASLALSPETD